jgi:hypothetical protein
MVPEMASACVFVGDLSPVQRPENRAGQRQMAGRITGKSVLVREIGEGR